jgi:hypothetical protein
MMRATKCQRRKLGDGDDARPFLWEVKKLLSSTTALQWRREEMNGEGRWEKAKKKEKKGLRGLEEEMEVESVVSGDAVKAQSMSNP